MWWVVDESRAAAVSDVANRQVEEPNPVHDTTFLRVRLELHDMRERETTWIIFGEFYSHTVRLRRACLGKINKSILFAGDLKETEKRGGVSSSVP